ncbi:MAG: hypothetical protein HQ541_12170, partial [Mariniphaga sp.]|nr:hypothetical protein [Mariniphaga sp.]
MTEKEIHTKYTHICDNISERKLKPAFDQLEKLISEFNLNQFNDECRNLEQTYHYMLKYTVEGINDPERKKVYRHLIISVFELADKVNEALRIKYSSSVEYQKKKRFTNFFIVNFEDFLTGLEDYQANKELQSLVNETLTKNTNKIKLDNEYQQKIRTVFYHFWFTDKIKSEDSLFLTKLLKGGVLTPSYQSLIISGITLSLLRYFDEKKMSLLFDAFEKGEAEVRQRALIGILICFFKYDSRLQFLPSIYGRLVILNENHEFKKNLEWVILQFIRSKETEKLQQKIRDEIIPEMIKISPNLKNKINLDSLMEEGLSDDKNPEWEEIFKDSPGLLNKMEEFSELQMEGADVFLGSFSMLKAFPFFSEISNWFIPFFIDNPEISTEIDTSDPLNAKFLDTISSAPILCNSDKYSFCFSLKNLPGENREMIVHGMEAEMNQFKELEKE